MKPHLTIFFLGSTFIGAVDAAVARCPGPCTVELQETCEDMLLKYEFGGDCCSLQVDPVNGNCIIQISNGSCSWRDPCNTGCIPNCPQEGEDYGCIGASSTWFATSTEECPQSSYDALGRTQPCCPEEVCPLFASDTRHRYCNNTTLTQNVTLPPGFSLPPGFTIPEGFEFPENMTGFTIPHYWADNNEEQGEGGDEGVGGDQAGSDKASSNNSNVEEELQQEEEKGEEKEEDEELFDEGDPSSIDNEEEEEELQQEEEKEDDEELFDEGDPSSIDNEEEEELQQEEEDEAEGEAEEEEDGEILEDEEDPSSLVEIMASSSSVPFMMNRIQNMIILLGSTAVLCVLFTL